MLPSNTIANLALKTLSDPNHTKKKREDLKLKCFGLRETATPKLILTLRCVYEEFGVEIPTVGPRGL